MIWIISYEYEYILLESKIIFYRPIVIKIEALNS